MKGKIITIMKKISRPVIIIIIFIFSIAFLSLSSAANADVETSGETSSPDGITVSIDGVTDNTAEIVKILFILTVITLAPSILIMMTGFTRIVIVLSCLRNAIGLQQTPPNQVLVGLALFLTLFNMSPVISEINTNAYQPYEQGLITSDEAIDNALKPLRTYMLKQTEAKELNMFISLANEEQPEDYNDIKTEILIPAFITSELSKAFTIGFMIYLPFLIIDMVVASTLMSMGMVMLPPSMISLPFKIMVFVVMDGWDLVIKSLLMSFN